MNRQENQAYVAPKVTRLIYCEGLNLLRRFSLQSNDNALLDLIEEEGEL